MNDVKKTKPKIDLTGKRFGFLTVLNCGGHRNNKIVWHCKCKCGNEVIRDTYYLTHAENPSCGCLHYSKISESNKTHGMSNTRLYKIWEAMKRRCNSPKAERYHRYGGRGIKYCKEWEQFLPFYQWALNSGYSNELSIDRIDVNGNYEPGNCRWVTMKEQQNNTSQNRIVKYKGETMSISKFSESIHRPYSAVYQELTKLHWSPDKCAKARNLA